MRILNVGMVLIATILMTAQSFAQETAPTAPAAQTEIAPDAVASEPVDPPEECLDENGEVMVCPPAENAVSDEPRTEDGMVGPDDEFIPEEPAPDEPTLEGELPKEP
jgi:hypothetical protein